MTPRTLFDKIWDAHLVAQEEGCPAVLYIDLHLIHEVTSPQAFSVLRERGLRVRRPDRTVATMDHLTSTQPQRLAVVDTNAQNLLDTLQRNCEEHGIELHAQHSGKDGIVHVIGPELGLTQPGRTIVCGDSHTATHGAFGALAFGIGTSEVGHVLATQCLLQDRPKTMQVVLDGIPGPGVTAKDMILALCSKLGIGGATGHSIEYTGSAIAALSMDERMTVCNMSIEVGARSGMIAPDQVTFDYLEGRPGVPQGEDYQRLVERWSQLVSDEGAHYDATVHLDVGALEPMLTYGTNPGMGIGVSERIPDPSAAADGHERDALRKALSYMGLQGGAPLAGHPIDVVFIGSCTNSRMQDLRDAARIFRNRQVHAGTRVLIVPGSAAIKKQAEQEGLDRIFLDAGAEWRNPGCSMCIAMNGDKMEPGQYAVSTSNRNFEGRQGQGSRTFLASPLSAAAAAVTGRVCDVRTLLAENDQ